MNAFSIGIFVVDISANWPRIFSGIKLLEKKNHKDSFGFFIDEAGVPQPIANRENWLKDLIPASHFPIICNGNEKNLSVLTVTDFPQEDRERKVSIIDLKLDEHLWKDEDLFLVARDLGIEWNAIALNIDPPRNTNLILKQIIFNNTDREIQYGLPPLPEKKAYGIKIYELPTYFAWINYWSEPLVSNTQIDLVLAKELFYKAELLENGAFVIQLTEAPLDLEISEHLALLKKAYKTFERVGGRHLLPEHLR